MQRKEREKKYGMMDGVPIPEVYRCHQRMNIVIMQTGA